MIHALSGMGGDHRLFPGPWTTLPDFRAHDWMPDQGERTIPEVAAAMCDFCQIRDGDSVVGASLGGMVACEIARIRKIRRLILVGSATSPTKINGLLSLLRHLAGITPWRWLQAGATRIPTRTVQMFSRNDPKFLRAMCAALFEWKGIHETVMAVIRIHGVHDRIIRPPAHADLFVDGRHMISLSHAIHCVEFIRANLSMQCGDNAPNEACTV